MAADQNVKFIDMFFLIMDSVHVFCCHINLVLYLSVSVLCNIVVRLVMVCKIGKYLLILIIPASLYKSSKQLPC